MPKLTKKCLPAFIAFLSLSAFGIPAAMASHLVGDEFTYKYLGDTTIAGVSLQRYRAILNIYVDCLDGQPEAIAQDNPAFFGVFDGSGATIEIDTGVYFSSAVALPGISSGPCGIGAAPTLCILKKTFAKEYYLPANTTGYTIAYQRCCKNTALTNIVDPGDEGSTYFCKIPPSGVAATNNGAVFVNDPPEIVALNSPFIFNSSATDADGDSLSYELCTAYTGANDPANSKPLPIPPPYSPASYISPLSYSDPMSCSTPIQIDPATGILTGTPNLTGRYLVTLCCHEWRTGVMIDTVSREFELAVAEFSPGTYHPYPGADTAVMVGDSMLFHASGAAAYSWSPGTYLSDVSIPNPIGHFPVPGIFTYTLHGVSDSGCVGDATITVTVLEHSECRVPNGFTPNGDGENDVLTPLPFWNSQVISFKVYNRDGKLLYSTNAQGYGWDGTYHGVMQGTGVYLWDLFYTDNKGQTREMKGNTMLIR